MKIFQTFTFILVANFVYAQSSDLLLQGVLDLDLPTQGFTGKATHLVATNNISDLSIYGLGTASNGGGSDSIELTLPAISVNAGDDILLARDTNAIHLYFGSCFNSFEVIIPVITTGVAAVSQNGNDAIELFKNGVVVETFGDINVDGTGTPWEYADSWAYKDAAGSVTFSGGNWVIGPVGCTVGSNSTYTSSCPYLHCTQTTFESNIKFNDDVYIYPNPFNKIIETNVDLTDVFVTDISGRNISLNFSNRKIFTEKLSNGIYSLHLKSKNKLYVKKIIKQ